MGVLGDESGPVVGEDSASASGLNGICNLCCFGAMDVVSDSIIDCVVVSTSVFDGVGEGDLLLRPASSDESLSPVTDSGFIFIGVLGFDLCTADIFDPSPSLPDRSGLRLADDDLGLSLRSEPRFRVSLSFLLISSPLVSSVFRLSSRTAV